MSTRNAAIMPVRKTFWDYFWFTNFFFRAVGILPMGGPSSLWKSILSQALAASPLFYGITVLIQPMNYIFCQNHTVDDLLEAVIVILIVAGGQCRSFFVVVNRRKITRLFSACRKLWDDATLEDYNIISSWAGRAILFSTTYFCAAQMSTVLFVLTSAIRQLSLTQNSTARYYPFGFEENFTPISEYEFRYTLQVLCGHLGMIFVAAADMTGTVLALNMCGQLALIQSWLLRISKEKPNSGTEDIDERLEVSLTKCICRHQVVTDLCAEVEEVVQHINLTQVVTGMYVLAISAARLMKSSKSYRYYGMCLLSISGCFFSCWPADNLSFVSSELAEAVYGLPWYRWSRRRRTAVAIMLARSQRPAKLTAGKFVVLSLQTFSSILVNSISFSMVLSHF